MTQPTKTKSLAGAALSAAAGTLVCAILARAAWAAGNDSFATGIVFGGAIGIAGTLALFLRSRKSDAPAEARLVGGTADERERRVAMRAGAFAGAAMFAAAVVVAMVTAIWSVQAMAGIAIIMYTGLFTATGAFAVLVRRN
jgi:hypothetical protein